MTKQEKVLKYLQDKLSGSKMQLRSATNIDNVGDAIYKLRNKGHNIVTVMNESSTGAKYAAYCYIPNDKNKRLGA